MSYHENWLQHWSRCGQSGLRAITRSCLIAATISIGISLLNNKKKKPSRLYAVLDIVYEFLQLQAGESCGCRRYVFWIVHTILNVIFQDRLEGISLNLAQMSTWTQGWIGGQKWNVKATSQTHFIQMSYNIKWQLHLKKKNIKNIFLPQSHELLNFFLI